MATWSDWITADVSWKFQQSLVDLGSPMIITDATEEDVPTNERQPESSYDLVAVGENHRFLVEKKPSPTVRAICRWTGLNDVSDFVLAARSPSGNVHILNR